MCIRDRSRDPTSEVICEDNVGLFDSVIITYQCTVYYQMLSENNSMPFMSVLELESSLKSALLVIRLSTTASVICRIPMAYRLS